MAIGIECYLYAGIKATYIGKPNRYIFDITLDAMGNIDRGRILNGGRQDWGRHPGRQECTSQSGAGQNGEFRESDLESPIVVPDYIFDSVLDVGKLFP